MMSDSETNLGGQPPFYSSPEDMQGKIEEYFLICDDPDNKTLYTITGLALYLGFESRQSLYDYEKKSGFSYPIKKAKLKIENQVECESRTRANPSGQIFSLKNFGWKDTQEVDSNVRYPDGININFVDKASPE